jgi:hypothetical protein
MLFSTHSHGLFGDDQFDIKGERLNDIFTPIFTALMRTDVGFRLTLKAQLKRSASA